jgi:hypothetical protein
LPVFEFADKVREKIMFLWHKRRKIEEMLDGRILQAVLHVLKAQTRGLGYLTVVQGDHYAAQVVDISTSNSRQVVNAYLHECLCEKWQHTSKPCQYGFTLITQQPIRDVRMKDFINEYYSIEMFRNAYKRLIKPLPDKKQWQKVDISSFLGAPLHKRGVGRKKKNRFKCAFEGGGGSKNLVLRARSLKKIRKYIEALSSVQIMVNWDIGKVATNVLLME